MFKKASLLTHPTLARRDAPFPKRGRSERRRLRSRLRLSKASIPVLSLNLSLNLPYTLADFFNIMLLDEIELNA